MLLIIEKVLILKTLSVFADTLDDDLARVAAVVEEVEVEAGGQIIEKDSQGECMYVIARGRVRVHDGDHTIAELEAPNVVGELAALDPEPRSASVTACTDTLLFRLDREALYEVMAENTEVAKGVIHVLCQRLRSLIHESPRNHAGLVTVSRGSEGLDENIVPSVLN